MEQIVDTYFPHDPLAFQKEVQRVAEISSQLTDEQKMIAELWAGSTPGRSNPPCQMVRMVTILLVSLGNDPVKRADLPFLFRLLCGTGIVLFHAGVTAWHFKRKYMQARPIQTIRQIYQHQPLQTWTGKTIDGSAWVPYQAPGFVTPPFPDFVSGHSTFSTATTLWIARMFGSDQISCSGIMCPPTFWNAISPIFSENLACNAKTLATSCRIFPGASTFEADTPRQFMTLSWDTWCGLADMIGQSREFGGIHYTSSNYGGKALGSWIVDLIQEIWP